MRLERSRRGKTNIDVTTTNQDDNKRIRISMGDPGKPGFKNTDLDAVELDNLIVILNYHKLKMEGKIPWQE